MDCAEDPGGAPTRDQAPQTNACDACSGAKVSDWDAPAPTAKPMDVAVQIGTRPDGTHPNLILVALCIFQTKCHHGTDVNSWLPPDHTTPDPW